MSDEKQVQSKAAQKVADDVARAQATQDQLMKQLAEQMKQSDSPADVDFSQVYENERNNLVRLYVGDDAFPKAPEGKTTAQMGDPFFGQKVDTIFDPYGDQMRLHEKHLREGWVPVVDKKTGEHVQTTDGDYLYRRPIEVRKARSKGMKQARQKQMDAALVPDDALKKGDIQEGVAFDQTSIRKGG